MAKKTVRVDFEPIGKRVEVEAGATLLDAAQKGGIEIVSVCGGMGTCERCRVQVMSGVFSELTAIEEVAFTASELAAGYRLACQVEVLDSCKVHIPPDSLSTPQRLQLEGLEGERVQSSSYQVHDLDLKAPELSDLRSDTRRLRDYLSQLGIPEVGFRFPILKSLSDDLRRLDWKARAVVHGSQVIGVLPVGKPALGLAVDIGTTKLAAYLIDLQTGEGLARDSAMNPQIHYGEDVISRIFYTMEHEAGGATLQARIVETLNGLASEMCAKLGYRPEQIVEAVVVGNTAMHHLFAGLPVRQLGLLPFVPAVSEPLEIPAHELGLQMAPGAQVYLPANIAGYVGADHVAMMLATGAYQAQDTVIALDIGTNTEISLVSGGRIVCCSCASGPAFEGAHLHEGMRAAAGAIERVQIHDGQIHLLTIGGGAPVGICGSGILDAIAEMARAGILDERGVMVGASPFVRGSGRNTEFVLAPAAASGVGRDLTVNRRDIQEILLAKAAIRTGIEVLLEVMGISYDQVDRFLVAGAFGTYLDLSSAIRIGMFPNLPLERFSQVGNAAGTGARQMLVSDEMRQQASQFAQRMEYVELTVHPSFKDVFMGTMNLKTDLTR